MFSDASCGAFTINNTITEVHSPHVYGTGAAVSCDTDYNFLTNQSTYNIQCVINDDGTGVYWNDAEVPLCKCKLKANICRISRFSTSISIAILRDSLECSVQCV